MRFTVSSLLTFFILVISASLSVHGHRVPLHRRGNCLPGNCLNIGHAAVNDQEADGFVAIFQQGNGHVPHAPVQVQHAQVANVPAANAPLAPAQVAHAQVANAPDAHIAQQDRSQNPARPLSLPILSCGELSESHYCVRHCYCTTRRLVSCPHSTLPPSDQPEEEAGPSTQTNEVRQKNEEYCLSKCFCTVNGVVYWFGKSWREWTAALERKDLVEEFERANPGREHSLTYPLEYLKWTEKRESK